MPEMPTDEQMKAFRRQLKGHMNDLQRETPSWTEEDPRMLREQCRIGDVAFQHLFCTSKGLPVPDWVTDGLPKMYQTLTELATLRDKLKTAEEALREFAKIERLPNVSRRSAGDFAKYGWHVKQLADTALAQLTKE